MPKDPSATAITGNEVRVFISYAHPDADIAEALYASLKEGNEARVLCFLDTFTITSGDDWAKKIRDELQVADWLIFIYHEGRSYEFCGYEIGTFNTIHGLDTDPAKSDSRMFAIHDVEPTTSLLKFRQNRKVVYWEQDNDLVEDRPLTPPEIDFYANTPLGQFFSEFYGKPFTNPLFPVRDPLRDAAPFRARVAKQARRMTVAFRKSRLTDLNFERLFQHRMEIEIGNGRFWEADRVPDSAVLSGDENTFAVVGYAGGGVKDGLIKTTWGALKGHYSLNAMVMPWLDAIEDEIVEVGKSRPPRGEGISFKSAHDRQAERVNNIETPGFGI